MTANSLTPGNSAGERTGLAMVPKALPVRNPICPACEGAGSRVENTIADPGEFAVIAWYERCDGTGVQPKERT